MPMHATKLPAGFKLLLDFAPLAVFFVAYKLGGVAFATACIIVATVLCVGILFLCERRLALAPLISGGLVMVMGGLSLALNDEQFIKMKPTLVNTAFAAILLTGVYGFKRGLLRHVLDMAVQLTPRGWCILSRRWGFFFLFLAGLNECIWRNFSTSFWVDFKVFGMFSLTILFALAQLKLIETHRDA